MSTATSTRPAAIADTESSGGQPAQGIGPNAIIQLARAITASRGQTIAKQVYATANLLHYLSDVPDKLVDEQEVIRFHQAARRILGDQAYRDNARVAGQLTGDYLLANRIPPIIQAILKRLPGRLAIRILNKAIKNNAWTFVGSGRFSITCSGSSVILTIEDSPLARGLDLTEGACDFYAATFERLYQVLVNRDLSLQERCCAASGAKNCQFALQ